MLRVNADSRSLPSRWRYRMGVSQPAVAAIETPTDVRLSTLARYLDAIGGHGELVVEFPDHTRITIGLEQLVPANRR